LTGERGSEGRVFHPPQVPHRSHGYIP
jgi:hypothetical protein